MNRFRRIAAVLAGLAAGLVAFATPAFASVPPPAAGYTPVLPGRCPLPEPSSGPRLR